MGIILYVNCKSVFPFQSVFCNNYKIDFECCTRQDRLDATLIVKYKIGNLIWIIISLLFNSSQPRSCRLSSLLSNLFFISIFKTVNWVWLKDPWLLFLADRAACWTGKIIYVMYLAVYFLVASIEQILSSKTCQPLWFPSASLHPKPCYPIFPFCFKMVKFDGDLVVIQVQFRLSGSTVGTSILFIFILITRVWTLPFFFLFCEIFVGGFICFPCGDSEYVKNHAFKILNSPFPIPKCRIFVFNLRGKI